jgi:hypothetical protein
MDMLAKCKDSDRDIILSIYADELTRTHLALKRMEEEVSEELKLSKTNKGGV